MWLCQLEINIFTLGYFFNFLGQFVHFLAILADIWQNLVYLECHGRQCHSPTPKALRTNVCAFSLCLNICLLGCENKLEEKISTNCALLAVASLLCCTGTHGSHCYENSTNTFKSIIAMSLPSDWIGNNQIEQLNSCASICGISNLCYVFNFKHHS